MLHPKTQFEQVPLEIVRKILEEQIRRELTTEQDQGTQEKMLHKRPLEVGEQSMTRSRSFSRAGVQKQS
jgi:hypothetical protein